jgi:hypothetical protein
MVDNEGSTLEETCGETEEMRNAALGMNPNAECGSRNAEWGGNAELSPRRYHVFARAPDRDAPSTIGQTPSGQLWVYIAPIHRKRDAIAVSVGLVESGLAIEAEVAVIAQSTGPRAGKVIVIHSETAIQTARCVDDDLPPTASVGGKCL